MAVEFTIRDAAGNVQMDLSTRIATILGFIDVDNSSNPNGSINDAGLLAGEPFSFVRSALGGTKTKVTIVGQTVSWQATANEAGGTDTAWAGRILYGFR